MQANDGETVGAPDNLMTPIKFTMPRDPGARFSVEFYIRELDGSGAGTRTTLCTSILFGSRRGRLQLRSSTQVFHGTEVHLGRPMRRHRDSRAHPCARQAAPERLCRCIGVLTRQPV